MWNSNFIFPEDFLLCFFLLSMCICPFVGRTFAYRGSYKRNRGVCSTNREVSVLCECRLTLSSIFRHAAIYVFLYYVWQVNFVSIRASNLKPFLNPFFISFPLEPRRVEKEKKWSPIYIFVFFVQRILFNLVVFRKYKKFKFFWLFQHVLNGHLGL